MKPSVQNDSRVLVNFKSTDRPAWLGPASSVRHWVSRKPFEDTGAGAYIFVPHLTIDGTCFGAVALTLTGAVACLDEDDDPEDSHSAPASNAVPVGSRARGLVDCNVRFARALRGGAALLAGRRMQHIRLQDDRTYVVSPFFNLVTPVTSLVPPARSMSRTGCR